MAKRKIRDERDARRCLASVKAAGISRSEWARRNGVDGRSLYAWARNLGRSDKARGRGTKAAGRRQRQRGLVELIPEASHPGSRYVIRCGEMSVEVDEHFDEATVTRLLRVIAAC